MWVPGTCWGWRGRHRRQSWPRTPTPVLPGPAVRPPRHCRPPGGNHSLLMRLHWQPAEENRGKSETTSPLVDQDYKLQQRSVPEPITTTGLTCSLRGSYSVTEYCEATSSEPVSARTHRNCGEPGPFSSELLRLFSSFRFLMSPQDGGRTHRTRVWTRRLQNTWNRNTQHAQRLNHRQTTDIRSVWDKVWKKLTHNRAAVMCLWSLHTFAN